MGAGGGASPIINAAKGNESICAGQTVDFEVSGFSLFGLSAASWLDLWLPHSDDRSTGTNFVTAEHTFVAMFSDFFFNGSTSHIYLDNFQRSTQSSWVLHSHFSLRLWEVTV